MIKYLGTVTQNCVSKRIDCCNDEYDEVGGLGPCKSPNCDKPVCGTVNGITKP